MIFFQKDFFETIFRAVLSTRLFFEPGGEEMAEDFSSTRQVIKTVLLDQEPLTTRLL